METLLTHRAWVRRLARSLVRDGQAADDVEQRTWLAALSRPPQHEGTSRAWLGRVVRNIANDVARARRRRDVHELAAARPEALRATIDVVADAEAHARLVRAVHELAEPYRTTLLLRWFEDLPPRAVAERMDVPVETVRTRLRRAHDALREELGGGGGAGSSAWIAALAPLAGMRLKAESISVAAKAAGTLGGAVMGTKTAVAVAVGVAVAAAFVGGTIVGTHGDAAEGTDADPAFVALRSRLEALETARVRPSERQAAPGAERRIDGLEERAATHDGRLDEIEASLATVAKLQESSSQYGEKLAEILDLQKRLAPLVEKAQAPGALTTSPIRADAGQSPAQAVADLLHLDPARQAEFERAYDDVLRRLRETEARYATSVVSSDGATTTIQLSRFPEEGAALSAAWSDWMTRALSVDEKAKYDKYNLGRNLFPRGWPRIGEYERTIKIQKTPAGGLAILETGVSLGGTHFSSSSSWDDPENGLRPYRHLMK